MINTDFHVEFDDDPRLDVLTTDDIQTQTQTQTQTLAQTLAGQTDGATTEATDIPVGDFDLAFGFGDGVQLQLFPGQGFDSGFLSFL